MNCRQSQHLLSLDRDDRLPAESRTALDAHLAGCADCRRHRDALAASLTSLKAGDARIQTPDAKAEWLQLSARLDAPAHRPRRTFSPGWLTALSAGGALAALALVSTLNQPAAPPAGPQLAQAPARAEFVELGDETATPIIYVDQDSGWLIVWAEAGDPATSG